MSVRRSASTHYVESSALLALILEQDRSVGDALRDAAPITSVLTIAEASRGLVRAKFASRLDDASEHEAVRALRTFQRRCVLTRVTRSVLLRAGRPFPFEPIRTLDAIHLATLETLRETPQLITVVTRDARVRENARALGYTVA